MKKEIRRKRLDILHRIELLEKERCENCAGYTREHHSVKCTCTAAVAVRELGDQLLQLSGNGEENILQELVDDIKENGLTKEKYVQLKEHRLNDKEIVKRIGWYMGKLYNFKYDEGLSKQKGPEHIKLTEAQKQRALSNNIPLSLVRSRIRLHAWPIERAVTEPKNAYKADFQKWLTVAKSNGISRAAFEWRIKNGQTMEEAAKRPKGRRKNPAFDSEWLELAEKNGIRYTTFRKRVKEYKWTPEKAATEPIQGRTNQ